MKKYCLNNNAKERLIDIAIVFAIVLSVLFVSFIVANMIMLLSNMTMLLAEPENMDSLGFWLGAWGWLLTISISVVLIPSWFIRNLEEC